VNPKHLATLEFPKVLARLAAHTSFSAGEELALALTPAPGLQEIHWRLETTSEARALLTAKPDTTIGGAHDVRPLAVAAQHGMALPPTDLLDVRDTLVAARTLHRSLSRLANQFPHLARLADRISFCPEIVEEIGGCLNDRGEVRDDASPALSSIRRELRIAHDRIQEKLQNIITSPRNAAYLQEALITQRDGRYVIPLKADFKGRIRGVVHDVSSSGVTVFVEPLSVVELNNTWRELQIEEEQELHRILLRLSSLVAGCAAEIEQTVEALAELDLAFAKAQYAEATRATAPQLVPFRKCDGEHPGSTIRLLGARHPLLDPQKVVPIAVVLDDETHVLIITGPNTGGKTVSLKTVGLLVLMAQAGLHIPAEAGSALSPFDEVYADIGDEQSIEQSLSTFSSHLTNILSFLDRAGERSLVLLDELGAGTDPAEGAALARALLEHFRLRRATGFVATHYPELKSYAQLTPGVCNACVEFDPETLSPTYKLTVGLPGRSNAFAIARRLGLPHEIVEAARVLVPAESLRTEDMLTDIHRLRLQTVQARDEASAARAEADKLAKSLRERMEAIEEERREILEQAREGAAAELEALRDEARALRRRLQSAAAPLETVVAVEKDVVALAETLESQLSEPGPLQPLPLPGASTRPILPDDPVWVRPLNAKGRVIAVEGAEAEVQVGPARARVSLAALEPLVATPEVAEPRAEERPSARAVLSPGTRLDLRGCTVEEALGRLDRHLDVASRAELPWVHIIHGKGTGALRKAVRDFLADHPLVCGYEAGGDREGGEGVTVAKLVQA
jgi:DNA mismatch repair protein MutS2